jgi:Leucine-rich repeat (LRR) protein
MPAPRKYPSLPSRTESLNSWQTYESDRKPGRGPNVIPRAPVKGKWDELNPVQESTSFSSSKSSSHVGHRDHTTSSTSNASSNVGRAKTWEDLHVFSDHDEHVGQDKWEDINGFDSDYGSNVGQAKWEDINDFDTDYGEDVGQDKWEDMNDVYNDYGEDVGHDKWEDINGVYNDYGEDVGHDKWEDINGVYNDYCEDVAHDKWEDMNDVHNDYDEVVGKDKWEDMNGFGIYNRQRNSGQAKWEDINGLANSQSFIDDSKVAYQSGGSKKNNFSPVSQSTHGHHDARARNHPRSSNSNGHGQNASVVSTAMAANNSEVGEKPSTALALDHEYHELLIMYLRTMGTDMDVAEDIALRFAATQQATKDTGDDISNASMIPENSLQQIQTMKLDDNRTSRRTTRSSAPTSSIVPEPPRGQTQRRLGSGGRDGGPGRNGPAQNRAAGRTWTRARAPGAIQMDGRAFGAPQRPLGFDDCNPYLRRETEVTMTAPVEGHIVEATAVKDDASMPVVYAESSPLSIKHLWQERSLRRSLILVMVIVGIIVTVVVLGVSKGNKNSDVSFGGSTASPSSSPTFILEDLLVAVSLVSGEEAVLTPGTPQRNAVGWLSSVDEFLQERSGPALLQWYAMATLYYATQGNKWLIQEKWLDPMLHECDWSTTSNIKCATDSLGTRTIIGIDLTRAGLIGSIPKEIGQFQSLEYLRISNNRITGSLPSELLNLRKMNVLDVNSNALSGSLPVVNAKDLAYLDLSFNTITGEIPVSMFELSGLRILDLSYNHISGTVPRSIADIKVLSKLNLRSNHLHSTLPADFEDLLTIDFLNLDSNLLTGTLPYWVTGLVSRQELTVGNNLLSGTIPNINVAEFSFTSEMSIKLIDLSRNGMNGTVPMWAGLITSLKKLDISSNQFSGTLTVEIGMWKSLEVFGAANNRLTGVLPPYIPPALNYLDLSDNQFSGPLSIGLCNYTNLKFVSLAGNLLGGAVAPLLECMTLIKTLQLSRCALTGTIPPGMRNIVGLETFYAENNFLNGTIPSELGSLSFLQTFRISNNSFVGTLPTEFGRLVEMTSLHVDGNELQGTIPEELSLLTDLESLKVNGNYFEPTFPSAICTAVGEISVSDVGCEFNCTCCTNRTQYCGDDAATGGEAPGWNNVFVPPKDEGRRMNLR